MDKGLTLPKWVLIVWPKIPQMPQNLSVQFVCLSQKVLDFNEKCFKGTSKSKSKNEIDLLNFLHKFT